MKNNYHIRRNQPDPAPERIAAHQDFDALLRAHQKTKPRRGGNLRRLYISLSAAAAAALIGWLVLRPAALDYPTYEQQYFATQPYVAPPLPPVRPQFVSQRVTAAEGGVLEYPSGSRLVVPRAAFADDRGALVTGEVDVHYREFADYLDIFRGGIPMTYDSAGVRYTLLSAGMLEVFAEQNGRRVRLAPGKALDVELAGAINPNGLQRPPHYNVYRLDTAARNWVFEAPDAQTTFAEARTPSVNTAPVYPVATLLQAWETANPAPTAPVPPSRGRAGEPVFELDLANLTAAGSPSILPADLPENTLWQLAPGSTAAPRDLGKRTWTDARLEAQDTRTYALTLIAPEETLRVAIQPVLQGAALAAAQRAYAIAEADYLLKFQAYEQEKLDYRNRVKAEARRQSDTSPDRFQGHGEAHGHSHSGPARRGVVSRFRATSLGIWNADRPVPPAPLVVTVRFINNAGVLYQDRPVFLADRRRNTLDRYVATEATELRVDRNGIYDLWLLTEDNEVAVLPAFRSLKESGTVVLADPVPVANQEELRALLE